MQQEEMDLSSKKITPEHQAEAMTKQLRRKRIESKPKEQEKFKFEVPLIRYNQVIGMKRQKAILHKLMELPLIKPTEFEQLGVKKSIGIILYGPPGTGKTFLCKAVCGELNLKMTYVKPSNIMSKYVGESAGNVKLVFEAARKYQPCAIFIDEADVLLQSRDAISGEGGSNELKQAVSQMLEEVSEVHDDKLSHIYMLGATNTPWAIDSAHKRSGRFEYILYVKSPSFWERRKLFKLYLGKESTQFPEKFGKINYTLLAMASSDYSPADCEKICKIALINAIEKTKILVTTRSVQKAFWSKEGGKSSLDPWYTEMYHKYLIKKKNLIKSIVSKKYREKEPDKTKLDKADMEIYKELIKDVERHKSHKWYIQTVRLFGRGLPNLS